MPSIEVTIVTYNSAAEIAACLTSLHEDRAQEAGDHSVSVAVWDNASQDSTADLVESQFPEVRLHRSGTNLGFGQAQNALVAGSTADYVLVLNPDTVVGLGSLAPLVTELRDHPDTTIAGPVIYSHEGVQPSVQGFPTLRYELARLVAGRRLGRLVRPLLDADKVIRDVRGLPALQADRRDVQFLWATCWLLRRRDALRLGPFSPAFFLYDEDLETCSRVAAEKGKVVQVRASSIFHEGGASSTSEAKRDYMHKGRRTYYRETGGARRAATFSALHCVFDGITAIKQAVRRK